MQMKCSKKLSSFILCIVLTVTMALFTTGCNDAANNTGASEPSAVAQVQDGTAGQTEGDSGTEEAAQTENDAQVEAQVLGEGSTVFTFTVVDQEKEETRFEIHTDKEMVGDALQELELIDGDEGEYGLFVKTVNGITVDYDKDGKYWAFYVNDEYAQTGVDTTKITQGDVYSLRVE